MVDFTISKSKVGSVTERYVGGSYESVDRENEDGIKRMAILGLDNSRNPDFKVAYASDPVVTIKAHDENATHDELQSTLEELNVWNIANFTPIEVPHGETSWENGFKTTPDSSHLVQLMYDMCEKRVDDTNIIGEPEDFSVLH